VREGAFPLSHLASSEEAFTSSSVREVMPVVELDGELLGTGVPGSAARDLQAALRAAAVA
jgi:branched-subunit amino acid aminotransferase/4-amino-4-deoxychorismate lyase